MQIIFACYVETEGVVLNPDIRNHESVILIGVEGFGVSWEVVLHHLVCEADWMSCTFGAGNGVMCIGSIHVYSRGF